MTVWFCSLKTACLQKVDCRRQYGFTASKPIQDVKTEEVNFCHFADVQEVFRHAYHMVFLCVQEVFRQCTSRNISVRTGSVHSVYHVIFL